MKSRIIAVLIVLLGVAAYYYFQVHEPPEPDRPAVTPAAVAQPEPETEPQSAETPPHPAPLPTTEPPEYEEIPLPMLAESDPVALESLGNLVGEPAVTAFLASDNVVSRLVTTTDAMSSRQVPGTIQAIRAPEGAFLALPNDQPETIVRNEEGDAVPQFNLDPANYERYTPFVELLESADPAALAETYRRHYSLIQEAYRMQGYPDGDFNDRLLAVIDELLATPEQAGPLALMKPEAYYLFVDPELEKLTAGQKILLRMGPSNARRVKAHLAEIRAQLR
jgi:hypothetical protein